MRRRPRGAHQVAFAVRAPVRRGQVDRLRDVLAEMGGWAAARTVPRPPFEQLTGVHFARLLLLEDVHDLDGRLIPATLLYMSDVDAPLERHLEELVNACGPALDAAFGLCEGYPEAPAPATRRRYLDERRLQSQARYVNTVGRTVEQIRGEDELRRAIGRFLDDNRAALGADAQGVRTAIQDFVRAEPSLRWALDRAPPPPLGWRLREALHFVAITGALLAATPLLAVVVPVWALVLRYHEARDSARHVRPDAEHARVLGEIEDFAVQNQFSAIGFVKPGWFRQATIAVVLWLIDLAARHVFTRADLAGVKSIHFARWTKLDEGRRAIFTSNYDGSLESYMDDFVDKVAFGLNASFSHAVDYPRTRFLFFEGAKRELEFKDYLRVHQIPTQVWYSAYADLTAPNLDNNALIRSGLFGPMTDADAHAWLRRL